MSKSASRVDRKKTPVKNAAKKLAKKKITPMISPSANESADNPRTPPKSAKSKSPRRNLFGDDVRSASTDVVEPMGTGTFTREVQRDSPASKAADKKRKVHVVTPSTSATTADDDGIETSNQAAPSAKRRLLFGQYVEITKCIPNVDSVYKLVRKLTGNLGGNGYSGPIYGELTKHSMQKMIDLMVTKTGFSASSRFIDVGSGIGKPNLHVAQYPGVEFSCGVEMEHNRWTLGMTCLKACLNAAVKEREQKQITAHDTLLQGNTMFLHNNILEAKTFDPFTHVYMFSIGFPPDLWHELSSMWNRSDQGSCRYLICYAGPRDIIGCYNFDVKLLAQIPTSMHGSKESHMGYIYSRTTGNENRTGKDNSSNRRKGIVCDPLFKSSYNLVKRGLKELEREVDRQVKEVIGDSRRTTRSRQKIVFSKC